MSEEQRKTGPIDFYTFVFSLGSSAFVHLGEAPHPESQKTEVNLVLAQQTIDILGMLQQKTRGNLTAEEEKFLQSLLSDLRLRYVARSTGETGPTPDGEG
jgi:hypothetical protein